MSDSATTPPGAQGPAPCAVIVRDTALEAMDRHMSDDTAIEYGGVLVGTADPLIGLVIITAHEPLRDTDTADTVTFTRETWDEMTRLVMARHPGQRIVGWYHSHPRFGIFLSAHDLAIQTTFFSQPWQVAYVFDPVQHERGFFGWANYDIVRIPEWEIAATVAGVASTLPAHVPAHGEYITARLAEEAGAAESGVAAATTTGAIAAASAPDAAPIVQTVEASPVDASPGRKGLWAALALAAIVIGAVIAFVVNRNDNSSPTTSPTTSASTPTTEVSTTVARTTTTVATTVPSTEEPVATNTSTPDTSTPDTASTATDSSSPTTASTTPAQTAIPTPSSVTSPSARVAAGTRACDQAADGSYTPAGNCYVPLNNGNMVVYVDGSMTCADPPGTSIGKVSTFAIGVPGDPLALFGDGKLVLKCGDLTYAKNILAGGSATLDGLCGSSNTAIDDASLRCFAQNAETGAMAALVAGTGSPASIVAACHTSAGTPVNTPLTWTKSSVNSTWRIVSLLYDPSAKQFTASATRNGVPTTATFACS